MKNLLLLFLVLCFFQSFTQSEPTSTNWCGTTTKPGYMKWRNQVINNNVNNLQHDQCVNKVFSIVFYAVADSNGNGGVSQGQINNAIQMLNNIWSRICISFTTCSTVIIPHHPYNRWTKGDSIEVWATSKYWTKNTINFYLPDSIVGPVAGYASSPGIGNELIVVEKGALVSGTTIHEMGHFFGLPHTFEEASSGGASLEYVRRDALRNCYTNGDGFCDTEADCYPQGFVKSPPYPPCRWQPGPKDFYNNYYTPPVDNYMTYFSCKCKFTQEQYNFMALTALSGMLYMH